MNTPHDCDPNSWPALVHRLSQNWRALLRLLFALAVITVIAGAAWWLLGLGSVEFGPIVIHGSPQPVAASRAAGG
ncbi:hypothetical protein ACFWNN_19910 [Lentzea sp. NPDC058450]|uniref:hypothetical protein n=1 Tax=Lentzea sp. NPDC058450 TaxID=3346505 RepID=UPI003654F55D